MKSFVLVLLCIALVFSGCKELSSPVTDSTTSSVATATTTTAPSSSSGDPDESPWVRGEALQLENATKALTLPLFAGKNSAAYYHQGELLFRGKNDDQTENLHTAYDIATGKSRSLGSSPLVQIGSGSTCFSTDGRFQYRAYIVQGDFDYLSVFRTDLNNQTTECIEKIKYGRLMDFFYAEGECIWRLWSEDPNNDGLVDDFIRHIDIFNVSTGERTELFATEGDYAIINMCVANQTIYAIVRHRSSGHYSLDTFTLDGTAIDSFDLAFLGEELGDRLAISGISVGGDFVLLPTTLAGRNIVLKWNGSGYQLFQGLSETENGMRITGYQPPPSHNGFGYLLYNGALVRYDAEHNIFIEHALPKDYYARLFNEEGHLVIVYKDRIGGTATYYLFENISW